MKRFAWREIKEATAHAAAGGQALHCHRFIMSTKAPACFVREVDAGRDIGHLFDQDEARLRATARRLGVRVIVVEDRGGPHQHIDLCGGPMARALKECERPSLFGSES